MTARSFTWLATNGGAWSVASNWDDITDGIDPSLIAPGAQDSATVQGATGNATTMLTGPGSAAAVAFFNNVGLSGVFDVGAMSLGTDGNGGLLAISAGTVTAGMATVTSGSILTSGASTSFIVTGAMTLGDSVSGESCNLDATSNGRVQLGGLALGTGAASLYVDPTGSIEIGGTGGARPGALTIDAGAALTGTGTANAYGMIVNNGTITAAGGDLLIGATTGQGLLAIQAGAALTLNGATGTGQAVLFAGSQATLAIATEFDQPQGAITGFAPGDAIDMLGDQISAATYKSTGNNTGILTLFYGNQVADTLTLLGSYANDVFLTAGDGALGTLITVAPNANGGGTLSGGTSTPDQYLWTAAGSGNWTNAHNWEDVTTGANPAKVAPGVNNLVTIAASQSGSFTVIAGPADAASLSVTGDLAMTGTFALGSLVLGTGGTGGNDAVQATLDLLPATQMTAGTATIADGELSLSGGATLAIAGALTMGGGPSGIGLPVTQLAVSAGASLTAASLTLGGGSGDSITTDPTAIIEIGTAGGAKAGAVTIDPGATLSGNGQVNPFGVLVDNGTIAASGGALTIGAVTGTGSLAIGANAALVLNASTAVPVVFTGAGATLAVADELVTVGGTLTGFAAGDAIDIENDPITSVSTAKSGADLILTLWYNATQVAHFTLAGSYTGDRFFLVPDGASGTDVLVDTGNGGGGGGGGQGTTDLLSWVQPVSGNWNKAANWFDLTTNTAATAPPGTLNQVQITGPTGTNFQTIGGPAACAAMSYFGNTYLNGAFTTGSLTIGGVPMGGTGLTPGTLDIGNATSLAAATAAIIDGALLVSGNTATLTVAGTLSLGGGAPDPQGPDAILSASGGGTILLGGLSLGGGAGAWVAADALSAIEIGGLGDAQAGAVVIDAGIGVAGNGQINQSGLTIVNGTLAAQGGTLLLGAVSGTGALQIGATATLELTAAEACPIAMTGGGATLLLAGPSESLGVPLSGFAQGDQIVIASSQVGAVAYAPGAGNVGTLTLYNGADIAGTILLAGNFSGDVFTVQPDGIGTLIGVQAGQGGASGGTTTPDDYLWIGGTTGLWNTASNWTDITAGQAQAAIAPGVNDLDTIQGGTSAFTTITGPANAASLTLTGEVALIGQYAVGELQIGAGATTGLLALGAGTDLQAAQAAITGGIVAQGGTLLTTGTLTLQSGVLAASAAAILQADFLVLAGAGDAVTLDSTSSFEIGTAGAAALGDITIDAGFVLSGSGVLSAQGQIVDQGTITAMAGAGGAALAIGAVSGAGTLLIGIGANLLLQSTAAAALLIDFAGPGTLTVATAMPQAAIAGFGDGDVIAVPLSGITSADYAVTGPNMGILTLEAGDQAVATLTLVGVGQGQGFSVAAGAGGTLITTETNDQGGGGSNMRGGDTGTGGGQAGIISGFAFWQDLPDYVQAALSAFQANVGGTSYVFTSPDGSYFGDYQPGYANFAVVEAPQPDTIAGNTIVLPPGYDALLVEGAGLGGNVPLKITDGTGNHVLLVGNAANDTIVANGPDDTLVGGMGGNSILWASTTDTVYGGGNDTIITNSGPCDVTTSTAGKSVVFAGASDNIISLDGADTLVAVGGAGANDTVNGGNAGNDIIFAPGTGLLNVYGGASTEIVVGFGGTIRMYGGIANGSTLWCGNAAQALYYGGAGSAVVIGGSGDLFVQGGAGAVTVFAGSGDTLIQGAPGPSEFVAGEGASTITAAAGNLVWLAGAANDSLVATGGNATIWGANSTGDNVFQAGTGPCTLSGGLGNDTFLGGTGAALMLAGKGGDVFSFTNALAGGADIIRNFSTTNDQIDLHGYSGFTNALVGGSEVLSLSDGTTITLSGIGSMTGVTVNTA
jgi:fibronectin-binding autotransporter adhesin